MNQGKKEIEDEDIFEGDLVIAQSSHFIHDGMISRHATYAVADGDIGSVWECMKVRHFHYNYEVESVMSFYQQMAFTFAGSAHSKYTSYLLEMICSLELESSKDLKMAVFENWLVNPSGLPGHWVEGDLYQEQLQDELYEQIGKKDGGFEQNYVQHLIAPNVHRFVQVKKDINESLGLARRSGNHIAPHTNPEFRKLMDTYQAEELHLFRKGLTFGGDKSRVDHLGKGYERLRDGKLASWIEGTTRACNLNQQPNFVQGQPAMDPGALADVDEDEDELNNTTILTPGLIRMDNRNIIIDILEEYNDENENADDIELGEEDTAEDVDVEPGKLILGVGELEDWENAELEN